MSNPMIAVLKHYGDSLTRQNYLDTAYLGKPPSTIDPESEADLPDEPRFKKFREVSHEEVAAEEADKQKGKSKK